MATTTIECSETAWEWDKDNKSSAIEVTDSNLSASRPSSAGKNPAVLGVKPLNKSNPHFRIEIESIGSWLGIGLADLNFCLDGGKVIGSQTGCINSAYFHQSGSSLKLEGETSKKIDTPIQIGNLIDVYVDFDAHRILYWNNNVFVGFVEPAAKNLEEGKLYACANLSANTKIRFRNQDKPTLPLPEELKPQILVPQVATTLLWKWSTEKKADAVVLSENDTAASRPNSEGNNPAVQSTQALSRQLNHFRLKINSAGKWIGVGLADENYKLNGGSTLGNQKECTNISYFHQSNTTLNISGQHKFSVDVPIAANDVIDLLVDFDSHKVYFWNNDKFVGVINHASVNLEEHKLYPCVNLSASTTITLDQNPPKPQIPKEPEQAPAAPEKRSIATSYQPSTTSLKTSVNTLAASPSSSNAGSPLKKSAILPAPDVTAQNKSKYQAPTEKWKWSTEKKSTAVALAENDLSAARPTSEGSNPAVLATQPLTKANPHFRVKVSKMGNWIGIGAVDAAFALNGGSIIGGQTEGFNSAYFFQSKASLSLGGQDKISIDKPVEAGNIIDVFVNFDEQKIHYWNTGFHLGFVELSASNTIGKPMKEGELYPCVNLSANTEVLLCNEDHPLLKFDNEVEVEAPVVAISTIWEWSADDKPAAVVLSDSDMSASRPTVSGKNPAVRSKYPLTKARPHFQAKVTAMGKWVGIGVVDKEYLLDGSSIIGKQTGPFNAGYFKQTAAHLQMNGKKNDKVDVPIVAGDIIDIKIDFDEKKIYFWNNQRFVGFLEDASIEEGKLFPCANLAASTTVTLTNEPEPIGLPTEKPVEAQPSLTKSVSNNNAPSDSPSSNLWVWGVKRSDAVVVDNSDFTACRPDSAGSNPAVLASQPLTKERNWFRLKIEARGGWIGLGVADASFILNGGDTLGSQAGINCAYFDQNASVLQMTGETTVDLTNPINVNDLIDIMVDFDSQKILFWNNEEYVGAMAVTKNKLNPGELFACANLSATTKVTFRNEDQPKFAMPIVKQASEKKKDRKHTNKNKDKLRDTASTVSSPASNPEATPVELKPVKLTAHSWKWDEDPDKKSEALLVEGMAVSRPTSEGRNPALATSAPLSKLHPHFRIRILSLGNWIGIGIADCKFKYSGGAVVGAQTECLNGGFFQQKEAKIQLYGEDVVVLPEKVEANDVIDIHINFNRHKIHIWKNGVLFGSMQCKSQRFQENTLFPVVQLSANTKVLLEDTTPDLNLTLPVEKVVNKVEELTTMPNFDWTWDDKYKAEALALADDGHIAARRTAQGSNPAVRATECLTEERFHFRVKINQLGSWIAIGVCDEYLQMNEGAPFGKQVGGLNCAYASQAEGKIRMHGEHEISAVKLQAGDVIDVAIDFEHDKIFFWRNDQIQAIMECQHTDIQEGQVWPCVALSTESQVEFLNESPSLYMPLTKSKKSKGAQAETDCIAYTYSWKWSEDRKSSALDVSPDLVTVERPSSSGMNPAVLAASPLNATQSCFRIKVLSLGNWIGIGVAEKTYITDGGSILSKQDNCMSSGYFFQNTSTLLMSGEETKNVPQPIRERDLIDVKVDFDKQTLYFWNNSNFVGSIKSSKSALKAGEIFPVANLSAGTKVLITVPSVELKTGNQWTWSNFPERKSPALELTENLLGVVRPTATGSNPAVLAKNPLTKDNKHFRVRVTKMGKWIGIGVADANFQIDGGSVLGAQEGVNASYFSQSNSTLRMRGQSGISADPIEAGSVIDIMMDFAENKLYFWKNDELQGYLQSTDFKEGEIYPCANLSANTEIVFQNDDMPALNTTITSQLKKKLTDTSASLSNTIKWWPSYVASGISVETTLKVTRQQGQNTTVQNPIAYAENPFNSETKLNCFRIRVKKLGRFGGIGLCVPDELEGIFGSIGVPFACGWFWQTSGFSKIILETNRKKTAEVRLLEIPEIDDIIDCKIDFATRRVFFWRNKKPVGSIEIPFDFSSKLNLLLGENSLYDSIHPCAILSPGCEFEIENEDKLSELTNTTQMDVWKALEAPVAQEQVDRPAAAFPTDWQWSDVAKADSVEIEKDVVKSSPKPLKNGTVFTKRPFTTHSWYFQVKLVKVGRYGSFGVADSHFNMTGSKPLGHQVVGINAGYSWSDASNELFTGRIMMHNEENKEVKRPNDGDTLGIAVRFQEQKIYFYLNGLLAGVIYCVRNVLSEGKLFPAVCLSEDTQIIIENQITEPALPGIDNKANKQAHEIAIEYTLGETTRTTSVKWPISWTMDECLQNFCQTSEMKEFGRKEILLDTYAFWQPPQETRFSIVTQQSQNNKGRWLKGTRSIGSYTITGSIQFKQRYKLLQIKLEDGTTYNVKIELQTSASQVIQSLSKQLFAAVENEEYSLFFEPFKQFFQDDEKLAEVLPDNAMLRLEKKSVILEIEVPLESGTRMRKLSLSFSYGTLLEQVKSFVLAQLNIRKDDPLRENSYKFYLRNEWGEGGNWLSFDMPLKHYKLLNGQKLELKSASRVVNIEFPSNRIIERELMDNGFLVDESSPVGEIIQQICKQYNLEDPDCYGLGIKDTLFDTIQWLDPKLDLHQKNAVAVGSQMIMKKRIVTNVEMPNKKSGEVFHMAYTEAVDAVTSGRVLLPVSDFVHLAAIQMCIEEAPRSEFSAMKFLPPEYKNSKRAKEVLTKYDTEIEDTVNSIGYAEAGNDIYEMDNMSSKRNLRSQSVATATSVGSEMRSQDSPNILFLKKQYIQIASSSRSFGFYYKVRIRGEFAKSRSSRSAILGINEDHIVFVNSRERDSSLAPWAEFELNKLRRWACGDNTIFLDFGNHEPGLITLETTENTNIAGVLEAYINLMRSRERAKQNQRSKEEKEYVASAVSKINPTLVKFQSFNPDMPENDKTMILHEAVRLGKKEFVKLFIEQFGAKVDGERTYEDKESSISQTALHVAIEKHSEGSTYKDIARFLVMNHKADVNKPRKCVVHRTSLTTTQAQGAPVKIITTHIAMETPLHIALRKGDYIMAKWLINEGKADVRVNRIVQENQITTEEPCLYIATKLGNLKLVELLLGVNRDLVRMPCVAKKLGVEVMNETCLHIACNSSNKYESNQIVDELLKYNIDVEAIRRSRIPEKDYIWVRETALHIAADKNNEELVGKLLAKGANVKALRKYEKLSFFSKEETEKLQELAWSANDVAVSNNRSEESAIHIAVEKGYIEIVGRLLQHGADAWEPRKHLYNSSTIEEQPLHIATRAGQTEIISRHLIQDRSQPIDSTRVHTAANGQVLTLETALHIAVENGLYEVTELLLHEGADVDKIRITSSTSEDDVPIPRNSTPLFIVLQNFKIISDNIENDRYSLKQLKEAEQKRDNMLAIAELLLEKGANLNIKLVGQDSLEDTPLLLIVHSSIREIIKNPQVQQELRAKWSPPEKKIEWKHKETYLQLTHTLNNLRTTAKWRFWCETFAFITTLAILTAVILHNSTRNDVDTFLFNTALKESIALDDFPYDINNNPFPKTLPDVVNVDDAWLWIRGPLQSSISSPFVAEYARIIGNVTLRQVRVKKHSCKVPKGRSDLLETGVGCLGPYMADDNDNSAFGPGDMFSDYTAVSDEKFFSPLSNWYPQRGGFIVSLDPSDPTGTADTLELLQNSTWIDSQTRAVMAEMVVYNGNLNLFDVIRVLIEIPPSGLVSPSWNFFPTTLYYDSTPVDKFFLFLELVLIVLFYGFIIVEIREIRSEGKVWLTDPWNYIEVAAYFMFNWLIVLRIICFAKLQDIEFSADDNYIRGDVMFLSFMQIQEQNYAAILGLLYWVKLFKYLRVWKEAGILLRMVKDVFLFVILYVVFAVAFGLAFHVTLGYDIRDMRSWEQSLLSTFRMISGDFDYGAMESTGRSFGIIVFYVNFIVSTILLLNLLIAMLNKSYGDIIERSTQEYLLERAKLILGYENAKKRVLDAATRAAQKDSEIADIELVVMPAPVTVDEVAKKVFDAYTSKTDGQLFRNHMESFFTEFLVEFADHQNLPLIKTQIPRFCQMAMDFFFSEPDQTHIEFPALYNWLPELEAAIDEFRNTEEHEEPKEDTDSFDNYKQE